jgi:hydroxymethylbilane synthase
VVIGSRGSDLALAQANHIAAALRAAHPGLETEIKVIVSKGDRLDEVPLAQMGGKGVFTKELELALLAGEIDLAVHSLKDLPTEVPEGLCIAAIPAREDPFDVYVGREGVLFDALPPGARVGTSSLRRKAQLLALRSDLEVVELRGNVPTRLRKLDAGGLDAIILAAAGLKRLGLADRITAHFDDAAMLPAPGQGALAIETRSDDPDLLLLLRPLHDRNTAAAVIAERAMLQGLGGGCQTPVGALAHVEDGEIHLAGCVANPDGRLILRTEVVAPLGDPEAAGEAAAEHLLLQGAQQIFDGNVRPLTGCRVLITRPEDGEDRLRGLLEGMGAGVVHLPVTEIVLVAPEGGLPQGDEVDWIVFSSANGVRGMDHALRFAGRDWSDFAGAKVCAVGPATAEAARALGLHVTLTPDTYQADAIAPAMGALAGTLAGLRVLWPRGNRARMTLAASLREGGAQVCDPVVYETRARQLAPELVEEALQPLPDAVVFASPSAVDELCRALDRQWRDDLTLITRAACIGPATAQAAEAQGFRLIPLPEEHTLAALVEALVQHLRPELS